LQSDADISEVIYALPVPDARFFVSVARGQWPDRVTITDAHDTLAFEIEGSSSRESLSLRAPGGRELAYVQRHVATGGFEVLAGGRQLALVRRRSFGRYRIRIAGEDIVTRGSVGGGGYVLSSPSGDDLAVVSRSGWPATADLLRLSSPHIEVDIKPGNEPAILLAAVLAIEWLVEESAWPYWLYL
jgi:hypothetical protein